MESTFLKLRNDWTSLFLTWKWNNCRCVALNTEIRITTFWTYEFLDFPVLSVRNISIPLVVNVSCQFLYPNFRCHVFLELQIKLFVYCPISSCKNRIHSLAWRWLTNWYGQAINITSPAALSTHIKSVGVHSAVSICIASVNLKGYLNIHANKLYM